MSRDPREVAESRALKQALDAFPSFAALHAAPTWPALEARLTRLLSNVRRSSPEAAPASPRDPARLAVVHWNVEHGNRFEAIAAPSPQALTFDGQGMYGRYIALAAAIERPGAPFVAVTTHLDVHRTRAHRADQMRALMESLRAERRPIVLAGDFNTSTFDRGV